MSCPSRIDPQARDLRKYYLISRCSTVEVAASASKKDAQSDVRALPKYIRWLNPIFAGFLGHEVAWLRFLSWRLPVGLSVIALVRKPSSGR